MDVAEITKLIENYPHKVTDLRGHIKKFLETCSTVYPDNWSLFQKAYHELYLNCQLTEMTCPVCGIKLKFSGLRTGYQKNCSASCRNRNPDFLKKYKESCLHKYGTEYASQSTDFRNIVKATNLSKYGVDNPSKSKKIRKKTQETCLIAFGVDNPSKSAHIIKKIKQKRVANGSWIADDKRSDLENYRLLVKTISEKSYRTHFYKINPNNLQRARYQYHLDHIFSVEEGFKLNIPAEIIGHWTNLQLLWHIDNSAKNTKCDKSLDQLLEDYIKYGRSDHT